MPPSTILLPSFSSGEISPATFGRVDILKYQTGLKTCRNFIVAPYGSAKNRPGSVFVAEAKYADQECRVVDFIFSEDQAYIWEFGDEYIRFYTDQAQIQVEELNDENTNLLLHGDGTDASTTITDSSFVPKTVTANANAQIDTAQKKFGTASILFDGTGDNCTVPDHADWDLGSGNFTIEAWVRLVNITGNNMICGRVTSGTSYMYFGFEATDLRFRDYHASASVVDIVASPVTIAINTWYHVAVTRSGNDYKLFLDGVVVGSGTDVSPLTDRAVALEIGSMSDNATYYMNGWIDDFRWSKGLARYTAAFAVPTAALTDPVEVLIPYEIVTEYQEADLSLLRFESSADTTYITHPDYIPQVLSRLDDDNWTLDDYLPENGPFMPQNVTATTLTLSHTSGSGRTLTASAALFAALHVGALFKVKHYIESQTVSQSFTGTGTSSGVSCFTTWRLITHGTWTGKFKIEKSDDGGSTWTILRTFSSSNDFNANTFGTEDIETNEFPFLVRINVYSFTSGTLSIDLTTDPFFQEGIVEVTAVSTNISATVDILQTAGATTATDLWSEGSWSDYRGYPRIARFFQDRLVFASTYSEPQTYWMSEIGIYDSFIRHTPLLDTDAISSPLPSRQLNAINGLISFKKLVVFTSASEWSVGPVSGDTLTPTSFENSPQGYRGSYGITPEIVGNDAVYIQANSKVVRNLSYQFGPDGYVGNDLNILSKHLFDKYVINEIAYQQDPDSVVWMVRDDGQLLGLTYMAEQEVIAWHHHDTGGHDDVNGGDNPRDTIESICTIPGQGYDELWWVVNRTNGRFIERMSQRFISVECNGEREIQIKNQIFLDSCVSYSNETDIDDIEIIDGDVVVTIAAHGLSSGNTIFIDCVDGPTELNGGTFTVEPGAGDPDTLFMTHFNGADNATTATDSSQYARTITRNGTPIIDTAEYVFGGSSTYFPADGGTGSGGGTIFWSIPASSAFNGTFWNGDWTLEGRFQFEINNSGEMYLFSWFQNAFSFSEFYYSWITSKLTFKFRAGATAATSIPTSALWTPIVGDWYAIALIKSGNNYKFYVDGVQIGTTVVNTAIATVNAGGPLDMSAVSMGIGAEPNNGAGTPNLAFQGWVDEVRISKVARSATVMSREFSDATNSFVLYQGGVPVDGTAFDAYVSGGHISLGSTTGFDGLDHLEGQTVGILADGVELEQQVVVNGEVTLDDPHAIVHIGLPIIADFETLRLSSTNLQGRKLKLSHVVIRLEETRGGWIGPDVDHLYNGLPDAIEDKLQDDDPTLLLTGDVRVNSGGEYTEDGHIFIRQRSPYPMSILAVVPEVEIGGLSP